MSDNRTSAPHCREDGWLCEPGARCEQHLGDPVLLTEFMAGFAAGYRQGWDQALWHQNAAPDDPWGPGADEKRQAWLAGYVGPKEGLAASLRRELGIEPDHE